MFKDKTKLYISKEEISLICEKLGKEISQDYKDKDLLLICVLKGSVVFFADLVRQIKIPFEVDFTRLSSYGHGTESSGSVKILKDLSHSLKNKDVLIVEDILDTGITLSFYTDYLKNHQAKSVKICTLLDKPSRRKMKIEADYCGKKIEDHFVVGYGLDYQEICRNYPDIYQVLSI